MKLIRNVFIFFLLVNLKLYAQVYPVNGNAVLVPPYSVYLSDYTSRTTDRLVLNVVLNDVTRPELRVRLRIKIEGQNAKLETKPGYIGSEIILQGGVPLRLSGTDLIEYFNPNNLNFSGISRREFEKTGGLPQGFYTFCFEVLEYNRGVKISNSICAPGWLILNDPPIVNLPRNDEKVKPTIPQNVIFQWTPRHTGSPNSAFATEYDIEMVEVWPASRNPNDAILTSPRILETSTRSTTFIYGPAETPLELGRRYAFRVKAKSIVGAEEFDLFKNNGYSEVMTFVYGDACEIPQNILAEATSTNRFTVKWGGNFNHTGFSVRYKLAGNPSADWYTATTLVPDIGISGLQPNTQYEYQVAGGCGVFESTFSSTALIKTLDAREQGYACGVLLEQFNLDPSQLLEQLKVGEVFRAGDFDVKVAKVSGSNGTFSGEGVIEVPFFNKASVKAEFTDIVVNKELRMINGFLNVTGAGVEIIPSGVMDLMDDLSETLNTLDSALTNLENNLPQPFDPNAFVPDTVMTLPGPIIVNTEPDGTVVITDAQGNNHTLPPGTEAAIVDDKGNATLVDSKGKAHTVPASVATAVLNREYNLKLTFKEASGSRYGFDEKKYDELASRYEKIENNYFIPYKSVETGKTDNLNAVLEGTNLDKTKIRFEAGGVPVTATPFSGNQSNVIVTGKNDGEQEALVAIYSPADTTRKDQILGRVNVVTYNEVKKTLYIVPVNGNTYSFGTAQSLQEKLNAIYRQAVVNWSVTVTEGITVPNITPFDVGSSGMLSNYTDHMKDVIRVYKDNMTDNEDTYYLFLVSNPTNAQVNGFMPRNKQAGFILKDKHTNEAEVARTIAHELGHGAFNLHHTFMEENFSVPEGKTDNLMDYAGGTKLYKYQWDMMRYPAVVMGLFESDEESQMAIVSNLDDLKDFKNQDGTFSFYSPAGNIVTLPSATQYVAFSTADNWRGSDDKYAVAPIGTLIVFKLNDKTFTANRQVGTSFFTRYKSENEDYKDVYSAKLTSKKVIVGFPCSEDGKSLSFTVRQLPYSSSKAIPDSYYGEGQIPALDFIAAIPGVLINLEGGMNDEGAKKIYAQLSPEPGTEAIDFLEKNLEYLDCQKGTSFYVYGHAHQVNQFPEAYNACLVSSSSEEYYKRIIQLQAISNYGELSSIPQSEEIVKASVQHWASQGISYYKFLNDQINKVKALLSETNPEKINTTLNQVPYCILKSVNAELRKHLLQYLLEGNVNDYLLSFGNNKENLFLGLLNTAPEGQQKEILDHLTAGNNALLIKAFGKLDIGNNDEYVNTIVKWYAAHYPNTQELVPETAQPPSTYLETRFFYVSDVSGQISFEFDGNILSNNKINFQTTATRATVDIWGKSVYKRYANLDPMAYVKLEFGDDFNFLSPDGTGRIEPGTQVTVPIIWAYWFQRRYDQEIAIKNVRIALDVVAICSAPFTGGGSLATVEIIIASTDIAFTLASDVFDDTEAGRQLYEVWDELVGTYGAVLLAKGGLQVVSNSLKKYRINPDRFVDTYQSLKSSSVPTASGFRSAIQKIADRFTNVKPLLSSKFISEIRSMDFAELLVTTNTQIKAKVKNLTAALILKAGIEYKIGEFTINASLGRGVLSEIRWIESEVAFNLRGELKNAAYIDETGKLVESGSIRIVEKTDGTGIFALPTKYNFAFNNPLKTTFDHLISAGLRPVGKGNSILMQNGRNETVVIISENKITPVKWVDARAHNYIATEQGYWISKVGDEVYFDIGFKEGRVIKAEEVNDYLVNSDRAQKEGQPYLGESVIDEGYLEPSEKVFIVEYKTQPQPGGWGSKDKIGSISELREKSAVLQQWKNETEGDLVVREYVVVQRIRVRQGIIGPQLEKSGPNTGKTYSGGNHQYEFVEQKFSNTNPGSKFLKLVSQTDLK